MLLRTAAAARSATRTFSFRQASSSSSASKEAAQKAKTAAEDAAAKAKNVIGDITARSHKIAASSAAQRAKAAVISTTATFGRQFEKLRPKVRKFKYCARVGFCLVREVAIREKFGPPRVDQYPAAKAEFLALVQRAGPYLRDPDKIFDVLRAAKNAVVKQCYAPREALYETVLKPATKVTNKESVIAKQAVNEKGADILLAPFQGRKPVVERVRGSTLNSEIVSFLRSTFVVIEVLSFFAVGEIIGRRSLVGYSVPDNRPKEDHH